MREGLRCLQLSGALFLRANFSAPWAYRSPASAMLAAKLRPGGRRVILLHIFTEGRCRVRLDRGEEAEVEAGDIVILPFADDHCVGDPDVARAVPAMDLMPPQPWGPVARIDHGGGGAATSMVCGYLLCDDLPFKWFSIFPNSRFPALFAELFRVLKTNSHFYPFLRSGDCVHCQAIGGESRLPFLEAPGMGQEDYRHGVSLLL